MLRPSLTTAAVALLCASAAAQADLSVRPKPITAPFTRAGVFHVATGTWTRNASQSILGPDIIYNNSCNSGYYTGSQNGELLQHRSRLPTTSANGAPESDSQFYPGNNPAHQYDQRPGCDDAYVIQHFEVVYCTEILNTGSNTLDWLHGFADSYLTCAAPMVPDADCDFLVTGLPVGSVTGTQRCWIVDIDLEGTTCTLSADGNGAYAGPEDQETFGWSQGPASVNATPASNTGPVIAGNFTFTGGTLTGVLTPCTGVDGTIWDSPVNLAEEGTGMNSLDQFRVAGPTPSAAPGCYYFNGPVTGTHADFYLKLFSKTCGPPDPLVKACFPGQGSIINCPCGNPPAGGGFGCNNHGAGPAQSGTLSGSGVASLSNDSVSLIISGANNGGLTVWWTGGGTLHATGIAHAAGVRCVTANLKRLYSRNVSLGTSFAPQGADISVSARTAAVGAPISSGQTRGYFNIYRDPLAAGPCGATASTVNLTQAGTLTWSL